MQLSDLLPRDGIRSSSLDPRPVSPWAGYNAIILGEMKTAISLSDDTFQRVDHAARRLVYRRGGRGLGNRRSHLMHEARCGGPILAYQEAPPRRVLTTNTQLSALPGNVVVSADLTGLETDSVVNVTQVATVDRSAVENRIGALPDWAMAQVDAGLGRALALTHL